MLDFTIDLTNFLSSLQASTAELRDAGAAALFEEAETIMAASKAIVPVDEGVLRGSGDVELPEITDAAITVTMGYGGPAEAYALVQHERLDYKHKPGEQAKYLEAPFLEAINGLSDRLAARIREKVGA